MSSLPSRPATVADVQRLRVGFLTPRSTWVKVSSGALTPPCLNPCLNPCSSRLLSLHFKGSSMLPWIGIPRSSPSRPIATIDCKPGQAPALAGQLLRSPEAGSLSESDRSQSRRPCHCVGALAASGLRQRLVAHVYCGIHHARRGDDRRMENVPRRTAT